MTGNEEDPQEPGDEAARTVFQPGPPPGTAASAPPQPSSPPSEPPPRSGDDERTVFSAAPIQPPPQPRATAPAAGGRIAVGMVLNHIYEVRRFIARGGMGEVYEGVNINTDERVAIKVILSHLASDPDVVAMFRKEARTLTRLSHPALVQYRVLAQEPDLGVLYIVTDFIDGAQLADVIGKVAPREAELEGLIRRLASGLAAAHELGAIHRDMAPDNVLLPDGRLDQARIIDFGIAKDLDPTNKTIVGEGFAGKLGYVAPEQFGDYDRQVGPWTDVYSLALVLLALASGKPVDMGSTLVEAIERRRSLPDLSPVPEHLRPVFEGMLRSNPAERFRSMAEVLEALDKARQPAPTGFGSPPASSAPPSASPPVVRPKGPPIALIAAGGAVVLALVAVGGFFALRGGGGARSPGAPAAASTAVRASEQVRRAVEASLPGIACTWIDIDDVSDGQGGVALRLSGVAGSPADAQKAISTAAQSTGAAVGLVDASNVFPIKPESCAVLDAFRAFRESSSEHGRRFVSQQSNWELQKSNPPCDGPNAKAVVNMRIGDPSRDFSVLGMDRNGGLQQIFASRAGFNAFRSQMPELTTDLGGDSFSSTSCYNETGLVGELLITGQGPFQLNLPDALKTSDAMKVGADWLSAFTAQAKAKGWRTSMVWYRVVNDQGQ